MLSVFITEVLWHCMSKRRGGQGGADYWWCSGQEEREWLLCVEQWR